MSQTFDKNDDLHPEYDFTQLTVVATGKGRKQKPLTVQIDPDIADFFPNSEAVNEGLRLLIRLTHDSSSSPN